MHALERMINFLYHWTLSNVLNSHARALFLGCTMSHSLWMELGC